MTAAIRISGLEKTYSNGMRALKGIDLEVREGALGVVPGGILEHAPPRHGVRGAPATRASEAVGVVQPLQRCVTPDAQAAPVDRMVRVALNLHGAALARTNDHPAPGRALSAHRRVPRGDTGDDILRRHDIGNDPFDWYRRTRRHGCGRHSTPDYLEKGTPLNRVGQRIRHE